MTLIPGKPKHHCEPPVRVGAYRGQAISGVLAMSFFLGCGQWFGYTVRDLEGT